MRFISRFRGILASLRGFNLTLEVSSTALRPGDSTEATVEFKYRDHGVPEAEINLYQDEVLVHSERTGLDGKWTCTLTFPDPGTFRLIARHEKLWVEAESNEVIVTVGEALVDITVWNNLPVNPRDPYGYYMLQIRPGGTDGYFSDPIYYGKSITMKLRFGDVLWTTSQKFRFLEREYVYESNYYGDYLRVPNIPLTLHIVAG